MNKKKIVSLALAVIMLAILSFGTLAWFNDSDDVTNQFYIASSDDTTPDDIFSVDVWENTPDGDKDQDGYKYNDILPGDVLKKEVKVENTGYYDQYIRVTVTVTDGKAWMNVLNTTTLPDLDQIVDGYNSAMWTNVSGAEVEGKLVYTLYYNGILRGDGTVTPSDVATVFTAVKIPASMTQEQAALFNAGFEINVKAEAVQTENVGGSAYEAFQTVGL